MGQEMKVRTRGSCYHGNAGEASAFLPLVNRKLMPDGVMALVMPLGLLAGDSWEASRKVIVSGYKDLVVVSIASPKDGTIAFSADTRTGDCLIVGRKVNGAGIAACPPSSLCDAHAATRVPPDRGRDRAPGSPPDRRWKDPSPRRRPGGRHTYQVRQRHCWACTGLAAPGLRELVCFSHHRSVSGTDRLSVGRRKSALATDGSRVGRPYHPNGDGREDRHGRPLSLGHRWDDSGQRHPRSLRGRGRNSRNGFNLSGALGARRRA